MRGNEPCEDLRRNTQAEGNPRTKALKRRTVPSIWRSVRELCGCGDHGGEQQAWGCWNPFPCAFIGPLPPGDSEANSRRDIFHPGAFWIVRWLPLSPKEHFSIYMKNGLGGGWLHWGERWVTVAVMEWQQNAWREITWPGPVWRVGGGEESLDLMYRWG